ncbi:hypothetical protein [Bacteroides faecis]|uniref:hypothetical protein n=1 Tax=Bacteroides faecis TaxID=674529 RepID=UPI00286DB9D4|nr:hypothetical protein [Bacteroides faecis]MCS2237546.1 hypothetical protein [Bacteroides faecis]
MGDLKRFPTSNMSNALAGNVPGYYCPTNFRTTRKSTSEFWIRGISTFWSELKCLYFSGWF